MSLLDVIAQLFAHLARRRRELSADAFLAEFDRYAPPDPYAAQLYAVSSRELLRVVLEAHDQLQQRRKAGQQNSRTIRQDNADKRRAAIHAEATRLLDLLPARCVVRAIARNLKCSTSTVRRALRTHPSEHWAKGKRAPSTK